MSECISVGKRAVGGTRWGECSFHPTPLLLLLHRKRTPEIIGEDFTPDSTRQITWTLIRTLCFKSMLERDGI